MTIALAARAEPGSDGLPTGPVGDHLRGYISALNAADLATAARFSADDLSADFDGPRDAPRLQGYFKNQHRVTGGIQPIGFRFDRASTQRGVLVFRDRIYESVRALSISFAVSGDHRIEALEPAPTPAWAIPTPGRQSPAEVGAYAEALIDRGCRADIFSGAFLVAHDGKMLATRACGEADKRDHAPNTLDTRFNIGSMNKMLTAVAVMQLVEQHRVQLSDRIDAYLDDSWLPRSIASQITVAQLLEMRSGLGSYFDDGPTSRFQMNRSLNDYKPVMHAEPLMAKPGEKFIYSDTGYFLLGLVVQKASGEDYYEYIRHHVLLPAGMTRTDSYELDNPGENLALGYIFVGGDNPWRENRTFVPLKGAPDGGGYSTVGDLLKFANALEAGRLVTRSSLAELWTDHPPDNWGAGFYVFASPAGRIAGKDGFGPGISSEMDIYVDKGYVVVGLSNYAAGALPPMEAMRTEISQAR
jgi:CubicO group peptidase (beta-lactamase class C family)